MAGAFILRMHPRRSILIACLLAAVALLAPVASAQDASEDDADDVPRCPTGLAGMALRNGGVFFTFSPQSQHDLNVYRAEGDGEFELLHRLEFPDTRDGDNTTEPGQTYTYMVTAVTDNGTEAEGCETLTVTTVPFFPSWIVMLGAAALATAAYLGVRRR